MIQPSVIESLFKQLTAKIPGELTHFPIEGPIRVSNNHGVYVIVENEKKILHVGRTLRNKKGLCGRMQNHLAGNSSFTKKYLDGKGAELRKKKYTYAYIEVADHKKRAYLEALATGKLCPAHIGTGAILAS